MLASYGMVLGESCCIALNIDSFHVLQLPTFSGGASEEFVKQFGATQATQPATTTTVLPWTVIQPLWLLSARCRLGFWRSDSSSSVSMLRFHHLCQPSDTSQLHCVKHRLPLRNCAGLCTLWRKSSRTSGLLRSGRSQITTASWYAKHASFTADTWKL